jgi:ABC-type lipoprotein export system ATPase subunit
MNQEVCLTCDGLERYLGEDESRVHALRGVSLTLEPGTVHGVVGPSGCGKSTLLYILADEPTGNLDTKNSYRAFELLQDIVQKGGKALLLVTHNPEIAELCDWIHEMQDGRIVNVHPRGTRPEAIRR